MNDIQFLNPAVSNFLSQNSGGIFDNAIKGAQSLSIGPAGANPLAEKRGGIGGFFDRIEEATQSPLFGLGIGLLSGSPQQGFSNARSLSIDKADAESGSRRGLTKNELRARIVNAIQSGKLSQMSPEQFADEVLR